MPDPLNGVEQDLLHRQPAGGGVPVPRQIHHHRDEPAERVGLQEGPQPAPAGQLQHAGHHLEDQLGVGPEELGPGVGGEQVHRALAGVGVRRRTKGGQHRLHDQPQHRGGGDLRIQGAGGEHPEETVFAEHLPVRAEDPGADLERRHVPGQGGAGGSLGEQQVCGMLTGRRLQMIVTTVVDGVTQDAEAGAGDGGQSVVARSPLAATVAEERHVSRDQPVQEVGRLGDLLGRARGEGAPQLRGGGRRRAGEGAGVADHGTDQLQGAAQAVLDGLGALGIGQPVDQHMHPRLAQRQRARVDPAGFVDDIQQLAVGVPAAEQDRVQYPVHCDVVHRQGADHGIDQGRHVVGDDVDHRLGVRPPGAPRLRGGPRCGVEDPDVDLAHPAPLPDAPVAVDDGEHIRGRSGLILAGHMPEVGIDHGSPLGPLLHGAGDGRIRVQLGGHRWPQIRYQRRELCLGHRSVPIIFLALHLSDVDRRPPGATLRPGRERAYAFAVGRTGVRGRDRD